MRTWMTAVAVAALATAAQAQEFDAKKHHWTKWKEGSYSVIKMKIEAGGSTFEGTLKQTLLSRKESEYTIKIEVDLLGNPTAEEAVEKIPPKLATETIKAAGKELKCTVWHFTRQRDDGESHTKFWMPEGGDVPVKAWIKQPNGEEHDVTAAEFDEKVEAGGKKYTCVRLEGTSTTPAGKGKETWWYSPEVPGAMVKMRVEIDTPAGKMISSGELSEVEVKK